MSGGLVVFLQNAWSPFYAGGEWPRRSWLRALARSKSGQRLQLLLGERFGLEQCVQGAALLLVIPLDGRRVALRQRRGHVELEELSGAHHSS